MITIITGTPGSGKTAFVVDYIMDRLREGRPVYTFGIPDLLLGVKDGGDPQKWQTGEVIQIDTYAPAVAKSLGIKSTWVPRECMNCRFRKTCEAIKTNKNAQTPDAGAILVFDEAHTEFPAMSSGSKVPPHIEALTTHRHVGIDMVFISQRPTFMHAFIRGLASEHIHIELNPFSFKGNRKLYRFTEFQENINRTTKLMAAKSTYSPPVHVFPLYRSATLHTKLDRHIPNIIWFLIASFVGVIIMGLLVASRVNDKIKEHDALANGTKDALGHVKTANVNPVQANQPGQIVQSPASAVDAIPGINEIKPMLVSSCIADSKRCQCYDHQSIRVVLPDWECRRNANELTKSFELDERTVNNAEILRAPNYLHRPGTSYITPPPDREPITLQEETQQLVYTKTLSH